MGLGLAEGFLGMSRATLRVGVWVGVWSGVGG